MATPPLSCFLVEYKKEFDAIGSARFKGATYSRKSEKFWSHKLWWADEKRNRRAFRNPFPTYLHLAEELKVETGCALYIVLVKRGEKDLRGAARWEKMRGGFLELQPCPRGFIRPSYLLHGCGGGGGGGGGRGNACCPRRKNGLTSPRRRQGKFITLSLDTTFAAMQEGGKKDWKKSTSKNRRGGFFCRKCLQREKCIAIKRDEPFSRVAVSAPLKAPSALIPPSPTFFPVLLAQAEALPRSNNFSHRHFSPFLLPFFPFSVAASISPSLCARRPPPATACLTQVEVYNTRLPTAQRV